MPVDTHPAPPEMGDPAVASHDVEVPQEGLAEDITLPFTARAIYVGANGGDLLVLLKGGDTARKEVAPFSYHPIRATAILAGTTAGRLNAYT